MVRLVILLCFLFFTSVANANELAKNFFKKEFEEPSVDQMVEWIPEEVPRTVSIYFDTNGDGVYDLIIAYHLIEAYACKESCTVEVTEFDDHWVLVSSIGSNPYSYFVIKKWSLWKTSRHEDWQSISKTSQGVYKYKKYEDWYEDGFLKLWPDQAP
tara:strand:+ start:3992 stop:4459 length:468 start_codon:yes stop_codon:yes gene_type:complete